ncbi:beta-lactamase/transpeptidase-like protein [Blastocladiella britannica]|nr:beta-lactamase/transpeptidase-like protein [Blastocladiella britannica]
MTDTPLPASPVPTTTPVVTDLHNPVDDALQHVDALIPRLLDAMQMPGMTVSVHRNNKPLLHKAYGVRTLALPLDDPANALKTSTMFDLCSITKHFTAAAIGVLVHQGKLNWTDKVALHLPEFALPDALASRECTVLDILSHRTGIESGDGLWSGTTRNASAAFHMFDAFPHMTMAGGFRDAFHYSNNMFAVATVLIERVSGTAYPDFVTDHLLDPLGISAIWCSEEARAHDQVAQPHDVDDSLTMPEFLDRHVWGDRKIDVEGVVAADPPTTVDEGLERAKAIHRHMGPIRAFSEDSRDGAGTGFLFTSADDMVKWTACLLNGGKSPVGVQVVYDLDVIAKVHNVDEYESKPGETATMRTIGYGLGLEILQHGEYEVLSHSGGMPGYVLFMHVIPGANLTIFTAENQTFCSLSDRIVSLILESLLPLTRPDAYHPTPLSVTRTLAKAKLGSLRRQVTALTKLFGPTPPAPSATPLVPKGVALEDLAGVYKHPAFGYVTIVLDDLASGPLAPRLRYVSAPGTMQDIYVPLFPRAADAVTGALAVPDGEARFVLWPDANVTFRPAKAQEVTKAAPAAKRVKGRAWTDRVRYDLDLGYVGGPAQVYVRVD